MNLILRFIRVLIEKTKKLKFLNFIRQFLLILLTTKHIEPNTSDITITKQHQKKSIKCLYTTCLSLEIANYQVCTKVSKHLQ